MTAHNLSATVTDPAGESDSDTHVVNSTTAAPQRQVRRHLMLNRVNWSSAVDSSVNGPWLSSDDPDIDYTPGISSPPDPLTLGHTFWVDIPCKFVGFRVYKAPLAAAASIPAKIWSGITAATAVELGATTFGPWVSDGGGWRQVDFPTPVDLVPDTSYTVAFYSVDGHYAYNIWFWHAQDTVVWPIIHKRQGATGIGTTFDGNTKKLSTGFGFPEDVHEAANHYIDIEVEYSDPLPAYTGGLTYWDQWPHPSRRHDFMVAVFQADPPYLEDYYATGVNTLVHGFCSDEYVDAMNSFGNVMDWWPAVDVGNDPLRTLQVIGENSAIADQVCGYHLDDEPDYSIGDSFRDPDIVRARANYVLSRDSTRPTHINFGHPMAVNQGYQGRPTGSHPLVQNRYWMEFGRIPDVISIDRYYNSDNDNAEGRHGIWAYVTQIGRCAEVSDGRLPIWSVIETTSFTPDQPTPDVTLKTMWATFIAGARGVILFDHRFNGTYVTQDFAAMLSNIPMMAMISTWSDRFQDLAAALHAPDLGLVTGSTTSNTTEGPLGGEFGVRIHYTSRTDGPYQYVFAQGIRPGATTGTLTIPSWAGETVDVLYESRTETVSGGGVLTDTFAADYTFHLYRRTL